MPSGRCTRALRRRASPHFEYEEPLTTLIAGDLALTATPGRAQVVRRQSDGTWLRVLDRPDFTK